MDNISSVTEQIYERILKDRGDSIQQYIESGYTYEEIFKLLYPDETIGTDVMI